MESIDEPGCGLYYEVYERKRYLGYSTLRYSFEEIIEGPEEIILTLRELYDKHGTSNVVCRAIIDVCFMFLEAQRELVRQRTLPTCYMCGLSLGP
jgi:hypothetical protein